MSSTWSVAPLVDVASIERDSVNPSELRQHQAYVGLENIENGGEFTGLGSVDPSTLKSNKFRFEGNHLLYGKLRPYLAKIARPDFEGVCSTDILPIRPGPALDRSFLFHYLRTPALLQHASSLATGINLPRLSPKHLERFEIPLPPIEEQRRIAAVLDAADALRAKRRQAIAKVDNLTQAIFIDMFGAASLPIVSLGEVVHEFRYGTSAKSALAGIPGLRIPNVVGGAVDYAKIKRVPVTPAELERMQLRDGDVLFVRSNGNPDFVGRCAVFDSAKAAESGFDEPVVFASYLIRARLDLERVIPGYLATFLNGASGRRALRTKCKTSAGQYNLNLVGLGSVGVPLASLERQRDFVVRGQAVARHLGELQAEADRLDTLFASLQQRAFRGEL